MVAQSTSDAIVVVGTSAVFPTECTERHLANAVSSPKIGNITTLAESMEKTVTAAEANRDFSKLLRGVREGRSYVVTSHGKPVARVAPVDRDDRAADRAFALLIERLESQPAIDVGRWTRDELYDDPK